MVLDRVGGGVVDCEASVVVVRSRPVEESSSAPSMSACSGLWSGR